MKKKEKAFTLTELLVVVVIIGVLSAVVLPKFTKVLENFKTAEAEHVLEAVRNEQEARCTLGKQYTTSLAELTSLSADSSKHFDYTFGSEGMTAARKGESYSLQIPSYEDGRICCSGEDCEGFSYPTCASLQAQADYVSGSECAAERPCEALPDRISRTCGCTGHYVDVFDTTPGVCDYVDGTECVDDDASQCAVCEPTEEPVVACGCGGHYAQHWNYVECRWEQGDCVGADTTYEEGDQETTPGTGTQGDGTYTCGEKIEEWHCVDATWQLQLQKNFDFCGCQQTAKPKEESCGCGGHYEYTWNESACKWELGSTCEGEDQTECLEKECSGENTRQCGCGYYGTQTRECDTTTGQWKPWGPCSAPSTPSQTVETRECDFNKYYPHQYSSDPGSGGVNVTGTGKQTRTFSTSSCSWSAWGSCSIEVWASWGPYTQPSNKSICDGKPICSSMGVTTNGSGPCSVSGIGSNNTCKVPYGSGCYIYHCEQITQ